MSGPIAARNCPVLERTGDGRSVGRCWHYCPDGVCPRHGDVREPIRRYVETGRLTDENDLPTAENDPPTAAELRSLLAKGREVRREVDARLDAMERDVERKR